MLKDTFCSSPWFHIRINPNGDYEQCRWGDTKGVRPTVYNMDLLDYFNSQPMRELRKELLQGKPGSICQPCLYQDQHGKLSGRKKQLLKSVIDTENFEASLISSPHFEDFYYSNFNDGESEYVPTDLQIDLGNICNGGCIMCSPKYSTRLAREYEWLAAKHPIYFKTPDQIKSWSRDHEAVERVCNSMWRIPLKYIHLIGGEPFLHEGFWNILSALIGSEQSNKLILGTTTGGAIKDTAKDNSFGSMILKFREFHLGISIESPLALNDYVRYPSDIKVVRANIDKYLTWRNIAPGLFVSLRITPNVFTVSHLPEMFEFMIKNNVSAESCNILYHPDYLRVEIMPDDIRAKTIERLEAVVQKHGLQRAGIKNIRDKNLIKETISDLAFEYLDFLKNYQIPENAEDLRIKLGRVLRIWESRRNNSILTYAPEYENFLRYFGY